MTANNFKRLQKAGKEPTLTMSIRLPRSMAEQIRSWAKEDHRSINSLVVHLLDIALQDRAQSAKESVDSWSAGFAQPTAVHDS
jgi:hypothetical protein